MRSLSRALCAGLYLLLGALAVRQARADDWTQFRHDQNRSGMAHDFIPTRLMELWNWSESARVSDTHQVLGADQSLPVTTPCIWHGLVFAVSEENGSPFITCVQAGTGLRVWRQPLRCGDARSLGSRLDTGPAITASGLLYVPDLISLKEAQAQFPLTQHSQPITGARYEALFNRPEQQRDLLGIRAFRAQDGTALAVCVLPGPWPMRQFNSEITRLFRLDTEPWTLLLPPGSQSHWRMGETPGNLGPFLLEGDRLSAASMSDFCVRWSVGSAPQVLRIERVVSDLAPLSAFSGCAMTAVSNGLLIGDDTTDRFLGLIGNGPVLQSGIPLNVSKAQPSAGPALLWWRGATTTLGNFSSDQDRAFLPFGQMGSFGILGLDASTGRCLWAYPAGSLGETTNPPLPVSLAIADPQKAVLEEWQVPMIGGRMVSPDEGVLGVWSGPKPTRLLGDPLLAGNEPKVLQRALISRVPSGQLLPYAPVTDAHRVYHWLQRQELVALREEDGSVCWKRPLTGLVDFIGCKDRLIVSRSLKSGRGQQNFLEGYATDTGRREWSIPASFAGLLSSAYSLVFQCDKMGKQLVAYAPAERTFRMATDSDRPEVYRQDDPVAAKQEGEPAAEPGPVSGPNGKALPPDAAGPLPDPRLLADATVLRLRWDEPLSELLRKANERRRLVPNLPLLLVVDWLDATRSHRLGGLADRWSEAGIQQFAAACGKLAAACRPQHFEVGSEVNVYLRRHPEELEHVRRLILQTRSAVEAASPGAHVLVSFNAEVLMNVYGRTKVLPFGSVPYLARNQSDPALAIATDLSEVGLTTRPLAGYTVAGQMSMTYFTSLKKMLGDKPVVMSAIEVNWDGSASASLVQTAFMKKTMQLLYWLNSPLVAYPELASEGNSRGPDVALRVDNTLRPGMAWWQDALQWMLVPKLAAKVPNPTDGPPAGAEGPAAFAR